MERNRFPFWVKLTIAVIQSIFISGYIVGIAILPSHLLSFLPFWMIGIVIFLAGVLESLTTCATVWILRN